MRITALARGGAFSAALALAAAGCGGGDEAATCADVAAPEPRRETRPAEEIAALEPGTRYELVVETSCGSFTILIQPETARTAATSFVRLAEEGFYDGTGFHEIAPGLLIEGGDPTGTGRGGPGYRNADPPPTAARYVRGTVAMSKPDNTVPAEGYSGSRFFVVTAERFPVPLDDVVVGRVVEGMDTVLRIGALGNEAGVPSRPVVVDRITVETS